MMKTRHYTPEIKDRAVRMLIEALSDYPSTWSAIQAIAPKVTLPNLRHLINRIKLPD